MEIDNMLAKKWLLVTVVAGLAPAVQGDSAPVRKQVLDHALALLDGPGLSYAYGGANPAQARACTPCQACLETRRPGPKDVLQVCPVCQGCSLDCSHFVHWVYTRAGLAYPYTTTAVMAAASPSELAHKHRLHVVPAQSVEAGDLLVYAGHVVLFEGWGVGAWPHGDVVHASAGGALAGPGAGVRRERQVDLRFFRGKELLRVLRHVHLVAARPPARLRPNGD